MALVINIIKDSINDSGTKMYLNDDTGTYNASDNPGGYGTPNPERDSLALILDVYNKRSEDGDLPATVETYDPVTASEFTVDLVKDGWYQVKTYGLRLYDTATDFDITEVVYDESSQTIRKILTKAGSGPYTYTYDVISKGDINESTMIVLYSAVTNLLILEALCKCHSSADKNFFNAVGQVTNKTAINEEPTFLTYLKIDTYLKSIKNSFCFGSYTQAQLKVEQAEKICSCIDDNCSC